MLEIKDLNASVEDKQILKGINLSVKAGEGHAIMGPNGSGKSTLAQVIAGRDTFEVTSGSVTYFGKNLLDEEYRVSANSVGGLWNFTQYGAPLQWGIEFGMRFD